MELSRTSERIVKHELDIISSIEKLLKCDRQTAIAIYSQRREDIYLSELDD